MQVSQLSKKILDTPYVYLELQNGIISGYYKSELKIDLAVARDIVRLRNEFQDQQVYPALIFDNGVRSMNKEARDYFSTREGSRGLSAAALVLNSPFSKMFGNFLLKINSPVMPVKIFTDPAKAKVWLNQFKK